MLTEDRLGSGQAMPVVSDALSIGPLWISPNEMCEVRIRGKGVHMSTRHLAMLAYLVEANGKVVTREQLHKRSTGKSLPRGSRTVDVHITRIRATLGSIGRFLIAIPQRGYKLDASGLARAR
jgi:two-component system, OmpR family, alkaline phosphatase synthesis response regulator PhoP